LNIIKSLFEIRTLYFVFFVIGGIILSQSFEDIFISLTPILLKILSVVFVWQFTLGLNNIYDVKIDSKKIETKNPLALGAITKKGYFDLITIYLINALFLSLLLGFTYFGLIIAFAFAGFIYSVPPLRMRNRMFSTLFIGIGSVIAFLVGFGNIFIPREILIILFVILFGTSLGTTVKDLRDYESEKGKIKNLFTVYGKRKGKKIASILLLLSFLSPLLIFNNSLDIVFFSLFAFLSVLIFQKKEDYRFILILFFIIFVYSMFRII
jgi:4-hydroxybenzoate polyprenyltransferase